MEHVCLPGQRRVARGCGCNMGLADNECQSNAYSSIFLPIIFDDVVAQYEGHMGFLCINYYI